jgi:ABC-2 type transport system ATP-binding protein
MQTAIVTQALTKGFAGKRALDGLDLTVPRGAIFALLGDNGAGKSTTIRMLTGQMPPDAGRAWVLGSDCWADAQALRRRIGYVPERPRFYDWMTVEEIGWFVAGFHAPGYIERYRELAREFSLDPGGRLKALSKGGYAKVGLALALAIDPEVLILDEPTSGLDLFVRREFLASMVDLAGAGRTILLSSHLISEVERVASHAAFLAGGKLLLAGPLDEIRQRVLRLRIRFEIAPPDLGALGTVLEAESTAREAQAVLLDPDRAAVAELYSREGVLTVEESPLSLEDIYTSLLARQHRRAKGDDAEEEELWALPASPRIVEGRA